MGWDGTTMMQRQMRQLHLLAEAHRAGESLTQKRGCWVGAREGGLTEATTAK